MITKTIQVVPIDTLISIIDTFVDKVKESSDGCDSSEWCRNIELVSMKLYEQLVASGVIDPREDYWDVELGFYENRIDSINRIKSTLFDINNMISKYDTQENEDMYPVNPILRAIHDTLLSILQNQNVLTTATISFTIPNLIKHSEGVVNSWQY